MRKRRQVRRAAPQRSEEETSMGPRGRLAAGVPFLLAGLVCGGLLPSASAAIAQEATPAAVTPEMVTRGLAVWKKSDCAGCHGWAGHGRETEPVPPAPSLRQTALEIDQIREV